ncbi:MAG: hypothetical protein H0U70_13135 [Tatlockia sp.]|nr:hypothetical protein [Tatlockia sp.]
MLTKSEINKPPILKWEIKEEKDLDLCIEVLTKHEITDCSLHFSFNILPLSLKKSELEKSLASQKRLMALSLSAGDLTSNNIMIEGLIATISLVSLSSLTVRGLNRNSDVNLPGLIKNAPNLVSLNLNSNDLSYEKIMAITDAIISARSMQKIDLGKNSLSIEEEREILELLRFAPNLIEIYLTNTLITPSHIKMTIYTYQDFEQSLDLIEKNLELTHLILVLEVDDSLLVAPKARFIEILGQRSKLQLLHLYNFSNNYLNELVVGSGILMNHSSIEHFTFRMKDSLDFISIRCLAILISNNSKLISLSVGSWENNDNLEISFDFLFSVLILNTNLRHVNLSGNTVILDYESAVKLAAILKKNLTLKSLKLTVLFYNNRDKVYKTIFAGLADNHSLLRLDLDTNVIITPAALSRLAKNTSLIELNLAGEDLSEYSDKIEQIINRNIKLKIWPLYQKYLLWSKDSFFPKDLVNYIFGLMLNKIGIEEILELAATPSYKNGDYLHPPLVQDLRDNKINHFKTIYKALYEGQSSCFKHWNGLVDRVNLTAEAIEQDIKANTNKDSRTAKAWKLANNYSFEADYKNLFRKVHQYSHAHSSNFFGLFKRSHNFPKPHHYQNLETQIKQAEHGSRTKTIADIFEASSIKP